MLVANFQNIPLRIWMSLKDWHLSIILRNKVKRGVLRYPFR